MTTIAPLVLYGNEAVIFRSACGPLTMLAGDRYVDSGRSITLRFDRETLVLAAGMVYGCGGDAARPLVERMLTAAGLSWEKLEKGTW